MKKPPLRDIDAQYGAILSLESVEDCRRFFRDLLTENEIAEMAERWKAAPMLHDGACYLEIARATGLSSCTIAAVGRWLKQGKGGCALLLKRLHT